MKGKKEEQKRLEEACYISLKGDLESNLRQKGSCFNEDMFKDENGLFIEDLRGHKFESRILVIPAYKKCPQSWTRWAKKQNKELKKELEENKDKEELDNCFGTDRGGKINIKISNFVDYILKRFTFKTIFGSKKDSIYLYENGIYKLKGEEIIKTFSEKTLKKHCKNNVIREIVEKIKRKTAIDFEEFEKISIKLIPLENGVYNLETGKLEDYSPKIYFKFKLPITYDPQIKCPNFLKFIEDTLYPEDIKLIQEWFGFCLYRLYFLKQGMIWFGETDTGKTTLLKILEGLIGLKNCSGVSLQKISHGSNFDLASLHNKSLNSYDDLSATDISDSGGFKIATGGGSITGEYKFGDQFKFKNFSKLLFACNKIPSPKNIDDNAYFSRWLPIPFDNQINKKNQDPSLSEKCLKESSGIFNWALIGLKRLLKNKRFSFDKAPDEVKAIMCRSGNPIVAFIQDECKEQEGVGITKQDFYDKYCEYMRNKKLPTMTKKMFGNNMKRYCIYLVDGWKGDKRIWHNVLVGGYKTEKIA